MSSQSRSSFYDPDVGFISSKTPSRVWPTTAQAQAQDLTSPRRRRRPFGMRSQFSVVRAMVVLATSSALLGAMTTTLGYSVAASPIPQTSAPTSLDTSSSGLLDPSFSSLAPILPSAAVRAPHDQTDSVPTGQDRIDVDDIDTASLTQIKTHDDPFHEDDGFPPRTEYDASDRAHGLHLELNLNHSDHLIHLNPRQEPLQEGDVLLGFAYHTSVAKKDLEKPGYVGSSRKELGPNDIHPGLRDLKIPGLSLEPFADTFLYLLKMQPEPNSDLGMWDRDENEAGMPQEAHKRTPCHICGVYAKIPEDSQSPSLAINRDLNYHPDTSASIQYSNFVTFFYRQPPKAETKTKTDVLSKLISKFTNTKIPVVEFPQRLAGRWEAYAYCKPREFLCFLS
ncbi:hypothetical protein C8R42DRAFT_205234 [Lentinula raphanica]|nr:hypothetical protein C8R42DRAFT_205234 [Lentinula raphanica]